VVIAVKLIYGTGIGHYVMDGAGLIECLLNSIKPLHVAVASLTVKLQISFQDHRIIESAYLLRICKFREKLWIYLISEILKRCHILNIVADSTGF
jgi:hypothetical protein